MSKDAIVFVLDVNASMHHGAVQDEIKLDAAKRALSLMIQQKVTKTWQAKVLDFS